MDTNTNNIVQNFLFDKLSPDLIIGLDLISKLKFPINDKKSFEASIATINSSMSENRLKNIFKSSDFPINNIQNGLEKVYDRFFDFNRRIPSPWGWSPTPREFPEGMVNTPTACEVYHRDFDSDSANCGCQTYGDAIRNGENHLQATLQGVWAARHFRTHGVCGPLQ